MITLFASIVGFISSIIPEVIKYFILSNDKKYRLELLDKQIEYSKFHTGKELESMLISRDILEQASIYSTYKSNIKWVDTLNGSVRPVLAYSFFLIYLTIKYLQYQAISNTSYAIEYLDILWSIDDKVIFAGIISFYYGHRTIRSLLKLGSIT
ncbi:hypothetical protein OAP56_04300 [Rickettsiaceae bacterium]|nr:hypothetical protein [Rickettsiaceae bacterium]